MAEFSVGGLWECSSVADRAVQGESVIDRGRLRLVGTAVCPKPRFKAIQEEVCAALSARAESYGVALRKVDWQVDGAAEMLAGPLPCLRRELNPGSRG